MRKRNAYTLLEILIVVIIVGIIVWLTKNLFNTTRQDKIILWENCSNFIYGKLSNFASDISYGKRIVATNTGISYYKIAYSQNKIERGYVSWANNFVILDFISIGTWINSNKNEWCSSSSYSLATTGTNGMNTIALPVKGQSIPTLSNESSNRYIGTWDLMANTLNTGNIEFFVCNKNTTSTEHSSCIASSKILFDRRSQQIFLQKCASRNSINGKCNSRPIGF